VDVLVALGTVGAVIVAIWLGTRGITEQRGMEDRAADRQRSSDWYQQMVKLQDAAEIVRISFPGVTNQQFSEYEREVKRYRGFCEARVDETAKLDQALDYNDTLLSGIVRRWNGYNPEEVVTPEQVALDNEVHNAGVVLEMSSAIYTNYLVPFHQGQQNAGQTAEGIHKLTQQLFEIVGVERLVLNAPENKPKEPSNEGSPR